MIDNYAINCMAKALRDQVAARNQQAIHNAYCDSVADGLAAAGFVFNRTNFCRRAGRVPSFERASKEPESFRFFVHTPKAIKSSNGFQVCPEDRVFVAVKQFGKDFIAWKFTKVPGGISFWVSGDVKAAVARNEKELAQLIKRATKTGSEPTARFSRDSFYREVTEAEIWV